MPVALTLTTKTFSVSGEFHDVTDCRAGILIFLHRIISVGNVALFGAGEGAFGQAWKALVAEKELLAIRADTAQKSHAAKLQEIAMLSVAKLRPIN